jgi:pentatricopeptide repeat protein
MNNLEQAAELFDRMIDSGLEPDMVAYTTLISSYFRKGYIDMAVTLVTELSKKYNIPSESFEAAVKSAALKAKRFQYGE